MTTYNTYQEAKIANPESDISASISRVFAPSSYVSNVLLSGCVQGWDRCNPADYCMTVEKFLADGNKFIEGDLIINTFGNVNKIRDDEELRNELVTENNNSRYILRAAALENIPTETPEEKEVLDGIESAGEVEWKSGDIATLYGDQVLVVAYHPHHPVVVVETNDNEYLNVGISDLLKPETPQQREGRERLEAAYDLYCHIAKMSNRSPYSFEQFSTDSTTCYRKEYLEIVCKTNYRKQD